MCWLCDTRVSQIIPPASNSLLGNAETCHSRGWHVLLLLLLFAGWWLSRGDPQHPHLILI